MKEVAIEFEWARPFEAHARQVMEWRNDPQTLAMSYHHEPKQWESFFTEFKEEYFRLSKLPPLFACIEGRRVAFLRFIEVKHPQTLSRSCCEIGINLAPSERGKGLGTAVLKAATPLVKEQGYDDLYAEVRLENKVSDKVFLRAGYQKIDQQKKVVPDTGESCEIYRYLLPLTKRSVLSDSVWVIAEAGSNWRMGHAERDRAMAKELIDVAVESGADAVKFQTYRPETVYVQNAGTSEYLADAGIKEEISAIFNDLAMPYEMIPELADYCKEKDIAFMSTPFSLEDFEKVDPYVAVHKIASYEISHLRLIELAARSKKPLVMSTGASSFEDIAWAVKTFYENGGEDLTLLQCTAKYPADSASMNLRTLARIKHQFQVEVGLSDHSRHPTLAPVAAVAQGAKVIEKHYTLHNRLPGPDHSFALRPRELKEMVEAIRETEAMLGSPVKEVFEAEKELHSFARRGLQATRKIEVGESLEEGRNIEILRPGKQEIGLHPRFLKEIEGKKSKREIPLGEGIQKGDF